MVDKVKNIEDLEQMQAAAASQGSTIPNYSDWNNILSDLDELGIQSTGSYDGDKTLHLQLQRQAEDYAENLKVTQNQQQQNQTQQPQKNSETDNEQALKATVVNAVSSDIMANYMKVFHLLQ